MTLIFQNKNLEIYRFVFEYIDSNMYILKEGGSALIVDPHECAGAKALLADTKDVVILLTHEHPDHTSGINFFKKNFKTTLISTKETSDYLFDKRNSRPILLNFVLEEKDKKEGTNLLQKFKKEHSPYIGKADIAFEGKFEYNFCAHKLTFFPTLGHSKGSCAIFLDNDIIFTGDTLMKDYPIITRLPRGDKKTYECQTIPFFEGLREDLTVFPGHGKIFKLKELLKEGKLNVEFK